MNGLFVNTRTYGWLRRHYMVRVGFCGVSSALSCRGGFLWSKWVSVGLAVPCLAEEAFYGLLWGQQHHALLRRRSMGFFGVSSALPCCGGVLWASLGSAAPWLAVEAFCGLLCRASSSLPCGGGVLWASVGSAAPCLAEEAFYGLLYM